MTTLEKVIEALAAWELARKDGGISHADFATFAANKLDEAVRLLPALSETSAALQIAARTLETVYRERDPQNLAAKCAAERLRKLEQA